MKNKLLLLFAFFILGISQHSYAGFPVKHTTEGAVISKTAPEASKSYDKIVNFTDHVTKALHIPNPIHHRHGSDTLGLLSLIFGILSCVLFSWGAGLYFGIPAIILGAIGLSRGQRYALAGLILGCISFLVTILALILFVALLSAIF